MSNALCLPQHRHTYCCGHVTPRYSEFTTSFCEAFKLHPLTTSSYWHYSINVLLLYAFCINLSNVNFPFDIHKKGI